MPQVSVLLSAFNAENTVEAAIASIRNQSFVDWELIVINDASTDSTLSRISQAIGTDSRCRLISNSENKGLAGALNEGLAIAQGKYIARQDADDVSLAERFELQFAFLESNPRVGGVGTQVEKEGFNGRSFVSRLPSDWDEIRRVLPYVNPFVHGTLMIRRECLDMLGGYRSFFRYSQDYDLLLRLSEITELANLNSALYRFRIHEASVSSRNAFVQRQYAELARRLAWERKLTGTDELLRGSVPLIQAGTRLQRARYSESYRLDHIAALNGYEGRRLRQLICKAGAVTLCPWRLKIIFQRRFGK